MMLDGRSLSGRVDPKGQPGHYDPACIGNLPRTLLRRVEPPVGRFSRANHGHTWLAAWIELPNREQKGRRLEKPV